MYYEALPLPGDGQDSPALFNKGTVLILGRVAPFVMMAGLVYSRRTPAFHVLYLRRALQRPFRRFSAIYARAEAKGRQSIANPVLERWLTGELDGKQSRALHVVAGDSLLGKTSTALNFATVTGRRGLYFDLFAVQQPADVRKVMTKQLIEQNGSLARLITPLKLDLRVSLPTAVRPSRASRLRKSEWPLIMVNHAGKVFIKDKDDTDAQWLLLVLLEAARHCEVVLLCSDEAALMHLLPNQELQPFMSVMFCPSPPHALLSADYSRRCPEDFPEDQRNRLGRRMSQLFRRSPDLGNEMLRAMARGHSPGFAAKLVLEQGSQTVAARLGLGKPSCQVSVEVVEETLLNVECALLFALSATGHLARQAQVERFDPAACRIMQMGLLRLETARDGSRHLRVAQDAAIIWALSSEGSQHVVRILIAEARRCTTGDVVRFGELADGVEFLLSRCLNAREKLATWMKLHMDGIGPDHAMNYRTTLRRFEYPNRAAKREAGS